MTVAVAVAETVDYLLEQYNLPVTAAVTGETGETVTGLETEIVTSRENSNMSSNCARNRRS